MADKNKKSPVAAIPESHEDGKDEEDHEHDEENENPQYEIVEEAKMASADAEYLAMPARLSVYMTAPRASLLDDKETSSIMSKTMKGANLDTITGEVARNRTLSADQFAGKGQNMDFYYFELANTRGKSVQDRVLALEDFYAHVSNPEVRASLFKGYLSTHPVLSKWDWNTFDEECKSVQMPILKLFGIFDGHGGQFASTFAATTLAFEMIALKDQLVIKNYEYVLSQALQNLHDNLKNFEGYTWEAEESWCAAGTTVSVALVSDNSTAFAFLGDSPIYVILKDGTAEPVFPPHSALNPKSVERLIESKSPVGQYESGMLNVKFKIYTSSEASKKDMYNHIDRVSLAGLNCWGSVGDSIADPDIFNLLITEMEEFKAQLKHKKTDQVGKTKYKHFVRFLKSRPAFGTLRKHVILVEDSRAAPLPITTLLKAKNKQDLMTQSPLHRVPDTKKYANKDLIGFMIACDGVADFNDADFLHRTLKVHEDHLECAKVLKATWNTNTGDDRSAIMAWYV
jgi:serine/threonine protein phosphatase PrpC